MSLVDRSAISVRFRHEHLAWIDERANALHVSRSHVLRWLVEAAMGSNLEFTPQSGENKKFNRLIKTLA